MRFLCGKILGSVPNLGEGEGEQRRREKVLAVERWRGEEGR
jgi:hypothetical protein